MPAESMGQVSSGLTTGGVPWGGNIHGGDGRCLWWRPQVFATAESLARFHGLDAVVALAEQMGRLASGSSLDESD